MCCPLSIYISHPFSYIQPYRGTTLISLLQFTLTFKHALATIWPRVLGGTPRKHIILHLNHKEEDLKDMAGMLEKGE